MANVDNTVTTRFVADTSQFKRGVDQARDDLGKFAAQGDNTGKRAIATGSAIGSFFGVVAAQGIMRAVDAFKSFVSGSIAAAQEAEVADRRIAQIATSMGLTASQVASATKRLDEYSTALMKNIAVDDETIKTVQAKLLTFKNLTNTVDEAGGAFDRTTQAAFDLAAAGFGEATNNATQLGKALQDPIRGLTALRRSGVTFTESEKERIKQMVEAGKVTEAQNEILKAIEQQVGGTAAATVTGSQRMRVAFGELQERLGKQLLPAFNAMADFVTKKLIPAFESVFDFLNSDFIKSVSKAFKVVEEAIKTASATIQAAFQRNSIAGEDFGATMQVLGDFILKYIVPIFTKTLVVAITKTAEVIATAIDIVAVTIKTSVGLINSFLSSTQSLVNGAIKIINPLIDAFNAVSGKNVQKIAEVSLPQIQLQLDATRKKTSEWVDESTKGSLKITEAIDLGVNETLKKTEGAAKKAKDEMKKTAQEVAAEFAKLSDVMKESRMFDAVQVGFVGQIISALEKGKLKITEKARETLFSAIEGASKAISEASAFQRQISDTLFGYLSISDAFDTYNARQQKAAETLKALRDFQADLGEEATESQLRQLEELQTAYQEAQHAAATGSQNVVEEFISQAEKFKEFGEKMKRLLSMGLNRQTFEEILRMGADRGGELADAYLNGNTAELIARTNATVSEFRNFADTVGAQAASQFMLQGMQTAIEFLRGLIEELLPKGKMRKSLMAAMDNLAASMNRTATVAITTQHHTVYSSSGGGGGGGGGGDVVLPPPSLPPNAPPGWQYEPPSVGVPEFAKGGIVARPMIAMIGEAGPEAVIPLSQLPAMVGGGGNTYSIQVNVPVSSNAAEVGRQVVDAITAFERRNGRVYEPA